MKQSKNAKQGLNLVNKLLFLFSDYGVPSSSHQLPPGTVDNYESIYETIRHPAHERGGGGGVGGLGLQLVDNEEEGDFDSESDFDEIDEEETDESSEINSNSAKRRHHSHHHHPHLTNAG